MIQPYYKKLYYDRPSNRCLIFLKVSFYWLLAALILPGLALGITEHLSICAFATNIVLPAGIYCMIASLSDRPIRSYALLLPWIFLGGFQLVLLFLYGRSIIAVDMFITIATSNTSEASELLFNLALPLAGVLLLYLPPLIMACVAACRKVRFERIFVLRNRVAAVCLLIAGSVILTLTYQYDKTYNVCNDLFPVNVCYNLKEAVKRTYFTKRYHSHPPQYVFGTYSVHPDSIPELYVVIIGETSRADNWQLYGYKRPTTPELMNVPGLTAYPRVMSESNTTFKSVPMLLSHLDSHTYSDSLRHIKSIITAFREAGFSTAAISNQQRNGSYIEYFLEEADTCLFIKDLHPHALDMETVENMKEVIKQKNHKQLIVIHTYGSHFKYSDRYTNEFAHFKPDHPLEVSTALRSRLINAYDNSILYTSHLLDSVINVLEGQGYHAAMFYTSDHGEDLYDDDRELLLHASPTPSYNQLHVPFLIWMSHDYIETFPEKYSAAQRNINQPVSSSASLFPTVMNAAGLYSHAVDTTRSLVSDIYRSQPSSYLTDRDESVSLSEFDITHP